MKSILAILSPFLFINLSLCQKLITARVVDFDTNKPIDNVIILKEGDSLKTTTNYLGYFQLTIDSSDYLIIEKEGYETSKIKPPEQNSFSIKIKQTESKSAIAVINEYEKGELLNGYKTGIWEYYDEPGEVALQIDYDTKQILYLKPDTSKYAIQFGGKYKMMRVDQQPRYIGSIKELQKIIDSNVSYPPHARRNSTVGQFHVIFEVDSTGLANNFEILNDIGDGCGDEVLKALKLVPNFWIPANVGGRYFNSRFTIPVTFKIEIDGKPFGRPRKSKKEELPIAKKLPEIVITAAGVTKQKVITGHNK